MIHDVANDEVTEEKQQIYDDADVLDDEMRKLLNDQGDLSFDFGPVTASLESVLKEHRIVTWHRHFTVTLSSVIIATNT